MLGLVASCSASSFSRAQGDSGMDVDGSGEVNGGIWLDPTAEESRDAEGSLVMACMPALGTLTNVRQTGSMTTSMAGQASLSHLIPNSPMAEE